MISLRGAVSQVISGMSASIVARDWQAVSLARALTQQVLFQIGTELPHAPVWSHVDDMAQTVVSESPDAFRYDLLRSGWLVSEGVSRLRLRLADKSVAVPSSCPLVCAAAKQLQRAGICVRPAATAEDLGVATAAGARRAVGAQTARGKKG